MAQEGLWQVITGKHTQAQALAHDAGDVTPASQEDEKTTGVRDGVVEVMAKGRAYMADGSDMVYWWLSIAWLNRA